MKARAQVCTGNPDSVSRRSSKYRHEGGPGQATLGREGLRSSKGQGLGGKAVSPLTELWPLFRNADAEI